MKVRVDKVPINGARLVRSGPSRVSRSISVSLPSPHAAPCHLVGPSVCLSARSLCSGPHCLIAFARSEQGPNGSGCAVREGNGHQFHGFSGEHLPQPVVPCRSVATGRDDTHGTEVKQATDVSVSHLRYFTQPFLAATGMGFRRQPERHAAGVLSARCRQVTRGLEAGRNRQSGGQNAGGCRADAGAIAGK